MINLAVLYNVTFVFGRAVFWMLQDIYPVGWFVLDYTCDFLYLIDMFIRMHEGIKMSFCMHGLGTVHEYQHLMWKGPKVMKKFGVATFE